MPPRLYKFQRFSDRSRENLRSRLLWFSKPIDFNDPFDCAIRIDRDGVTDAEILVLFDLYRNDPRVPDKSLFDAKYLADGQIPAGRVLRTIGTDPLPPGSELRTSSRDPPTAGRRWLRGGTELPPCLRHSIPLVPMSDPVGSESLPTVNCLGRAHRVRTACRSCGVAGTDSGSGRLCRSTVSPLNFQFDEPASRAR